VSQKPPPPQGVPPFVHPVACDGGASANTPAPNRTASPLAISVLIFAASFSWRLLRHQFDNRDFRLVSHQLLGVVGDHAQECEGQCRAVVVALPGLQELAILLLANSELAFSGRSLGTIDVSVQ
jgi:hypothetical protein